MKESFYLKLIKNKLAIFLIIFLLSFIGYKVSSSIPKSVFPNVFFPRIQVTIENGYSPVKQMLFQITKSSEEKLKSIQGIEKVVSATSVGSIEINLYFDWNTDPYLAYQLVQARMAELKNEIPPEAKITIIQATPSRYPVSIYALGSDSKKRSELTNELFYKIKPYLLSVSGIYDVEIIAPEWEEYKIVLNTEKIKSYSLDVENITKIIQAQDNINFLGLIKNYQKQYVVSLYQKAESTNQLLNLKIPLNEDKYINLSEIATIIKDKAPATKMSAGSGNEFSVVFNILRQPSANTLDVAKDAEEKINELNKELKAQNMVIKKYYDESDFINKSIQGVKDAVILGTLITTLIVFIFLRKFKLSLFLLISVPAVFMITSIGLKLFKFDFNIFVLGGMAASVGGLIDHIIIVIENIEKHYKKTGNKLEAVITGSKEIIPIMSIATIISISLFFPLLLVSGVVGVFFKQLSFVIISSYIISQLLAIFFTPIIVYISLSNKKLDSKNLEEKGLFNFITNISNKFLGSIFKISFISIPLTVILIYSTFYMYKKIPYTFLPEWDEGGVVVDIVLPHGTSLEKSFEEFMKVGNVLNKIEEIKNWTVRVGASLGSVSSQPNVGDFLVIYKDDRKKSGEEIKDEIRERVQKKFANFDEFDLPQVLEDRLADILGEETPISVLLFGSDPDQLIEWGDKLQKRLKKVDILEEVNLKTSYTSPSINVKLKEDAEVLYGIDVNALAEQINSLYFGELVGNMVKGEKIIGLRIILSSPKGDLINYLKNDFKVYSPKLKNFIPISYVAELSFSDNIPEINHYNLSPISLITLRFKGDNMSLAVEKVKEEIEKLKLPSDIIPEVAGFYKEQQKSFEEMVFVILLAILIIFISILLLFNDLKITIAIMLGLLISLFGVFASLIITKKPLDITGFMGMLIVLSIVINNNILIFYDFIRNSKELEDKSKALQIAVKERFRAIVMTMISNVFSLLPIALAIGAGTEIIQNMAISIMGGLGMSIISSLFIVPMIFNFLVSFDRMIRIRVLGYKS
ncbi:MAG: efflux RND transporter permease subunit [Candidatus Sericytochromatia bacterium]